MAVKLFSILRRKLTRYDELLDNDLQTLANAAEKPYKVYTALLTQKGTDDPVATILENTLGFIPSWERTDNGKYSFNFNDTIDINKLFAFAPIYSGIFNFFFGEGYDVTLNTSADDSLSNQGIEIRLYN